MDQVFSVLNAVGGIFEFSGRPENLGGDVKTEELPLTEAARLQQRISAVLPGAKYHGYYDEDWGWVEYITMKGRPAIPWWAKLLSFPFWPGFMCGALPPNVAQKVRADGVWTTSHADVCKALVSAGFACQYSKPEVSQSATGKSKECHE